MLLRLACRKSKEEILQLYPNDRIIEKPIVIIREAYILDFLKLSDQYNYLGSMT